MKVLIADGSLEVADRLLALMQEIPSVELLAPTTTARATLESVRMHNPLILILDARIPGSQGTELLRALRRERPGMILIILSIFAYPRCRERYEAAGAHAFLDKSNEFIHLKQFVGNLVNHPNFEALKADPVAT